MIRLTGEISLDIVIPSGSGRKAAAITAAFDRLVAAARKDFGDDGLTLRETTITGAKATKDGDPYTEPDGLPLFKPWAPSEIDSSAVERAVFAFDATSRESARDAADEMIRANLPGAAPAEDDEGVEIYRDEHFVLTGRDRQIARRWNVADAIIRAAAAEAEGQAEYDGWFAIDDFVVRDEMFERQSIAEPEGVLPLMRAADGHLEIGMNGVVYVPPMADSFCAEDGPVTVSAGTGYSDPDADLPGFLRD